MRPFSPLCARHAEQARLRAQVEVPAIVADRRLLYGRHLLRFPLMALMVSRELGPVRHALAQRAIAGTVEIHEASPRRRLPPKAS